MSEPSFRAPPHGRIVRATFRPHPLLRSAHLQTMLPALLRPSPAVPWRRERLELDDGDFVDLGWAEPAAPAGGTAALVHGLAGGPRSKYLCGLTRRLLARGWRVCVLQLRGGGDEPNRLPRSYHHGDTADLRHLWRLLRARYPRDTLAAIGWSLGGNVILKALAEEGEQAPVDLAAAASVPFQLLACATHVRRGFARVYQAYLLDGLRCLVRRKAAHGLPASIDVAAVLAARDFFGFDDAFTAPLNGFADSRDYYRQTSCGQFLHAIRRPTLIVHALDDPFMPPQVLPPAPALSPFVQLEVCEHGGHVGFVASGAWGRPQMWLERRFESWLRQTPGRIGERAGAGVERARAAFSEGAAGSLK